MYLFFRDERHKNMSKTTIGFVHAFEATSSQASMCRYAHKVLQHKDADL
jgi:hypothetical protein